MRNKWLDALKPATASDVLERLFAGDKYGAVMVLRREVDLVTAKAVVDDIVDAEPWLLAERREPS